MKLYGRRNKCLTVKHLMILLAIGVLAACGDKKTKIVDVDCSKVQSNGGYAYTFPVPELAGEGDTTGSDHRSTYKLMEIDKPLEPGHASHTDIRDKGTGRWSHWEGTVYFSTSDNSNPCANNRKYWLVK